MSKLWTFVGRRLGLPELYARVFRLEREVVYQTPADTEKEVHAAASTFAEVAAHRINGRRSLTWSQLCEWAPQLNQWTGHLITEENAWEVFRIVNEAAQARGYRLFGSVQPETGHTLFLMEPTNG